LGCETTAPCDTSFKARRIEISLLTYLLTYLPPEHIAQSAYLIVWSGYSVVDVEVVNYRTLS